MEDVKTFPSVGIKKELLDKLTPIINFLFVVHNDNEFQVMYDSLKPLVGYNNSILNYKDTDSMQNYYIGMFYKYPIVLGKTADMGSTDVNSVINFLNQAIGIFRPLYIVMPGIAMGLADNLNIGDVIIANRVIGYEQEKISTDQNGETNIIGRYPQYRSHRLYNLLNTVPPSEYKKILKEKAPITGKNSQVVFGNYISGEKLVNNTPFRNALKKQFPEAKALDMEGIGIASASTFNRVYDWLIIKGISDLGDGKKNDAYQISAMKNVIAVLKQIFDDELSFTDDNLKFPIGEQRKNVLISSSQCDKGFGKAETEPLLELLSKKLIIENYNVLTGYGIGVGPSVLLGVFAGCEELNIPTSEYRRHFQAFAFPRSNGDTQFTESEIEECKIKNRKMLCADAQAAVFVFGNKISRKLRPEDIANSPNDDYLIADGMFAELDLVTANKALILPIGCTQGTAKKILDKIGSKCGRKKYLYPYFAERCKYIGGDDSPETVNKQVDAYLSELNDLASIPLSLNTLDKIVDTAIAMLNKYC